MFLETIVILLFVLFIIAFLYVARVLWKLNNKMRKMVYLDENMKHEAFRKVLVGSIWGAVAFALASFLLMWTNSGSHLSVLDLLSAAIMALLFGSGWGVLLLIAALVQIYWMERITLPLLQKKRLQGPREKKGRI